MIDPDRLLLLSIKPQFADAILDGTKTIELRRTRPRIEVPTEALIYASSPACALVGSCHVVEVVEHTPGQLWRRYGSRAGVNLAQFKSYFDGVTVAFGLMLAEPKRFGDEIPLPSIRQAWTGFQPPQSFRYLARDACDDLLGVGMR
jgi:predicted transcriptional regulator